jgi:hypothetical protein
MDSLRRGNKVSRKISQVDDDHYRVVTDGGRRSWLYETKESGIDVCIETAVHDEDGTTTAYEPPSFWDHWFNDSKGKKK